MTRFKITPLLILAVCLISVGVWVLFFREPKRSEPYGDIVKWLLPVIFFFMALVAGGIHLLFRKIIPELKKLWMVEGIIVGFVFLYIALQTYPMIL